MKKITLFLLFCLATAQAQVVNFPDAAFRNKLLTDNFCAFNSADVPLVVDANGNGDIEMSELAPIAKLYIENSGIVDLTGIQAFVNLKFLDADDNNIASLAPINGLLQLEDLSADRNALGVEVLQNLPALRNFSAIESTMTSFTADGLPSLEVLIVMSSPVLTTVFVNNMPALTGIATEMSPVLESLTVTNCPLVTVIGLDSNAIRHVDFSNCAALTSSSSPFDDKHLLETLNLANCASYQYLNILEDGFVNSLNSLNISGCTGLVEINLGSCALTTLDLTNKPNLTLVYAPFNSLTSVLLDASNSNLGMLDLRNSNLSTLNLTHASGLIALYLNGNPLTTLDVSPATNLIELAVANTTLAHLDAATLTQLDNLDCSNSAIETLNIKNGRFENALNFDGMLALTYVCADEDQVGFLGGLVGGSTAISSYCDFVPGGPFNTITGRLRFDADANNCDAADPATSYVRLEVSGGSVPAATFTNATGIYNFYTGAGDYTVTPALENPAYFTLSPSSATANFPLADGLTEMRDFCLAPNGSHPDLSVALTGQNPRPGFQSYYTLVYRNDGNNVQSGTVSLTLDSRMTLVSSDPVISGQSGTTLSWNFTGLAPLASRAINLVLVANVPTATPPLNSGDIVNFEAAVSVPENEQTPQNNVFTTQIAAVNSYDPNDKRCLEGETVTPENIGGYLHYNIYFENLGTTAATNVVIQDFIDTFSFDPASLQIVYASHPMRARLSDGLIEFIFENINLPPSSVDPIGGHGNVLFKIKTRPNLQLGDVVTNTAGIYFDYNHPVYTNEARTTVALLRKQEFGRDLSVLVHPNPASDKVSVQAGSTITSLSLFDIQGRVLRTQIIGASQTTMDLSAQSPGIYFLKITTQNGTKIEKLIKK